MSSVKIFEVFISVFSPEYVLCTKYGSHKVGLVGFGNCLPKSGLYLVDKGVSSFSPVCVDNLHTTC